MEKDQIIDSLIKSMLHVVVVIFINYDYKIIFLDELVNENKELKYIDFGKYAIDAKILGDADEWIVEPLPISVDSIKNIIPYDKIDFLIKSQNHITKINELKINDLKVKRKNREIDNNHKKRQKRHDTKA